MEKKPLIEQETDELEDEKNPTQLIDEKIYQLKINNISYILQIQFDLEKIYFKLYENKEKNPSYYSNEYDLKSITKLLKLFPDIYNNLNKIMDLLNTSYNNNKLQLSKIDHHINIIIKIINGYIEVDCPILLIKKNINVK